MTSTPCKAKNPNTCAYHARRNLLEKQYNKEVQKPAPDFEAVVRYRNELDRLERIIPLEEGHDLATYAALGVPDEQVTRRESSAIRRALRYIHEKEKYDDVSWSIFAKYVTQHTAAQTYGPYLEKIYRVRNGYGKVNAGAAKGDLYIDKTDEYIEFKTTAVSEENKWRANVVQIRPHHELDAYHIVVVNSQTGKTELFVLTKEQMAEELTLTNNSLAHGTREAYDETAHNEYAIRFKARKGDPVYDRWVLNYKKPFRMK